MFPYLIKYGSFSLPTFSVMIMLASLSATFYLYYLAPKKGISQIVVLDVGIIATLAGILGSRIFHILVEAPKYYWNDPIQVFNFGAGGFVSHGAVLGIGISTAIYFKKKKLSILKYWDFFALSFPLIFFFVRLGCLGAGCCYGKPTDFFIHLVFKSGDAGYHYYNTPLHATQVYSMIAAFTLFFILRFLDQRRKFDGQIISVFLMSFGFFRPLIEFLRADADRGLYFNGAISTGQIMGSLVFIVGVVLYRVCKKRGVLTC